MDLTRMYRQYKFSVAISRRVQLDLVQITDMLEQSYYAQFY
jgi:hypothetical protein